MNSQLEISKSIIKIASPLVLTGVLGQLIGISDIFIAGRLSSIEQAAVSMVGIIRLISIFIAFSAATGVSALVSQSFGAKDNKAVTKIVEHAITLTVIMSLIISVIGYFSIPYLLRFMNNLGDPMVVNYGVKFMQIYFAGFLFLMLSYVLNASLQATGDTVTSLYLSITMVVLNIPLSFLFAFGYGPIPAYGSMGIILGTVSSWFVIVVAAFVLLFAGRKNVAIKRIFRIPSFEMYKSILSIGIPSSMEGVAKSASRVLLFRIINTTPMASFATAALGIGLVIENLLMMVPNAAGIATMSLFGQSLGRWQLKRAKMIGNISVVMSIIVTTIMALPVFIFAPQLIALFNKEANEFVVNAGSSFLRINEWTLPIYGMSLLIIAMLRGAGDTKPAFYSAMIGRWLILLPFAYITTSYFHLGIRYIWWAIVLDKFFAVIFMLFRWFSNKWQDVSLRSSLLYNNFLKGLDDKAIYDFLERIKYPIMIDSNAKEEIIDGTIRYSINGQNIVLERIGDAISVKEGKDLLEQIQKDYLSHNVEPQPQS